MATKNLLQAIHEGLAEEMRSDESVMVLGEDVGRAGGVFRVTQGLQEEFGAARVMDTPLAESLIVGSAIGLSVNGMRPWPRYSSLTLSRRRSTRSSTRRPSSTTARTATGIAPSPSGRRTASCQAAPSTTPRASKPGSAIHQASRWSRRRFPLTPKP